MANEASPKILPKVLTFTQMDFYDGPNSSLLFFHNETYFNIQIPYQPSLNTNASRVFFELIPLILFDDVPPEIERLRFC